MKDYRRLSNEELKRDIQKLTDELFAARREMEKRRGDPLPKVSVDFTSYITD